MRRLTARAEVWPITGEFRISRGAKTEAHVVTVEIDDGDYVGRGECVPYRRYGETIEETITLIEAVRSKIEQGIGPSGLQTLMPPSAARNAVDCALWDLNAKRMGIPVWRMLDLPEPKPVVTAFTLSLSSAEDMAKAAVDMSNRPVLKVKLGGDEEDIIRLRAVRAVRPDARIIVDGNEGFERHILELLLPEFSNLKIDLVEQPLRSGADATLETVESSVLLCADESFHTRRDMSEVLRRYKGGNIKLDKAGGLTEAAALIKAAKAEGLVVMVGCMVSTSLSIAPAMMLTGLADWVDLDGAFLLAEDRPGGLKYEGPLVYPPERSFWG